jgi:hypothetical protein
MATEAQIKALGIKQAAKKAREGASFTPELASFLLQSTTKGIFQETKAKRDLSNNAKGMMISLGTKFKTSVLEVVNLLSKNDQQTTDLDATVTEETMRVINKEALIVLSNKSSVRVYTAASKFRNMCKNVLGLVGTREDESFNELKALVKQGLLPAPLFTAYRNGEEDETGKLYIVDDFMTLTTTPQQLSDYAISKVREMLEEFELAEDKAEDSSLPLEPADKLFTTINPREMADSTLKAALMPTKIYYVFEYTATDPLNGNVSTKYAVSAVELTFTGRGENWQEMAKFRDFNTKETNVNTFVKVKSSFPNKLLAKEIENTRKGMPVLEWGHVTSLATRQIQDIYNNMVYIDSKLTPEQKNASGYVLYANLIETIKNILLVSKTIDSFFEDWSGFGVTGKDIYWMLQNANVEVNKINYIYKADPLTVPAGTRGLSISGSIEKKVNLDNYFEVDVTENYAATDGEIEGGFERARFNRIKGHLVQKLQNMIKKIHHEGLTKAWSYNDVVEALAGKNDSDSVADAAIKIAFGIPVDKGSGKVEQVSGKSIRVFTAGKQATNFSSSVNMSSNKKKTTKKREHSQTTTIRGGSSPKSTKSNLLSVINQELGAEVASNMKHPRLKYRTGRLALSAQATSANSRTIYFKYMRNPYSVFATNGGKDPWNSSSEGRNRDPVDLISYSIRKILSRHKPKIANSVSIGEEQ